MKGGFFRVDGADLETGEESYLVLQAATVAEAESVARKQGLLIAAVRTASSADWGATNGSKKRTPPEHVIKPVIKFESRAPAPAIRTPAPITRVPAPIIRVPAPGIVPEKIAPPAPAAQDEIVEPFDLIDTDPAEALPVPTTPQPSPAATADASIARLESAAPEDAALDTLEFAPEDTPAAVETEPAPQASAATMSEPPPAPIDLAAEDTDETLVTMSDTATDLSLAEEEELADDLGSPPESQAATVDAAATPTVQADAASTRSVPADAVPASAANTILPSASAVEEIKLVDEPPIKPPTQTPAVAAAPAAMASEMEMSRPGAVIAPTPLMSSAAPVIHAAMPVVHGVQRHDPPPAIRPPSTRPKTSVFADAPLSAEGVAWAAARHADMPAGEKPAPRESAEPVRAEPIAPAPMPREMTTPTVAAATGSVDLPSSASAAAPATSADAVPDPASSDIIDEPSVVDLDSELKETPMAEEVMTESLAEPALPQREPSAPSATAKEQPAVVKVVAVTAKPVMIPKMGLSDSLRRVGPTRPGQGQGSGGRLGPGARPVQPTPMNPVSKVITIVPSSASTVDKDPSSAGGAKPPAPPRPIAPTVVSPRRLARTPAAAANRRPPQALIPPAPIADVAGKSPAGPAAKSREPISDTSPAVVEASPPPTFTVSSEAELDLAGAKVAASSPVSFPANAEDDLQISHDALPGEASVPATTDFPSPDESLTATNAAGVSPAKVEPAARLKDVAADQPQAAPAIHHSTAGAKPGSIGFSPVIFLVLVPLASLLTLGGIALIVMTQLTSVPAAAVELEKLDFHVQMLAQIFLGGVALLGGLLLFVVAGLAHVSRLLNRRQ